MDEILLHCGGCGNERAISRINGNVTPHCIHCGEELQTEWRDWPSDAEVAGMADEMYEDAREAEYLANNPPYREDEI